MRLLALLALFALPVRAEDDTTRLAAGEVLVDRVEYPGSSPGSKVRAVVDAPPAEVWRIISDCTTYKDHLVRILESEELSREGNEKHAKLRCRTVLDVPWPMSDLTAVTKVVHHVEGGTWSRRWTLEAGDYTVNEGGWTITAFDAEGRRALVVYESHAVPTSSVPESLREMAQKRALPELMVKLRQSVAGLALKKP